MAKKPVSGVSGVLGELISPEPAVKETAREKNESTAIRDAKPANRAMSPAASQSQRARLGRPPGFSSRTAGPKEKVTLRIPSALIAEYRDWSWDARCQLSELVERALAAYHASHRRS
jgi:uncharacterized protein (DUF4415 family)